MRKLFPLAGRSSSTSFRDLDKNFECKKIPPAGNKFIARASHALQARGLRCAGAGPLKIKDLKPKLTRMKTSFLKLIFLSPPALCLVANGQAASLKGSGSEIPAYYNHQLFTIQFVEFSAGAEKALRQHNHNINLIYQSDPGLPGGQPFISVIDAVPGDGFNPLWPEVQITFTPGHTPRQLFSDDEIANAFNAGEITLESTGELY